MRRGFSATLAAMNDADRPHTRRFGELVLLHRRRQRLTQERLAERSGLHRNHIGLIEQGERSPTLETLVALSEGLGVKLWVLLRELDM